MSQPRQLTVEEARQALEFTVDWPTVQYEPLYNRMIEIDTEEFGLIEVSEEDYYKNYSKFR